MVSKLKNDKSKIRQAVKSRRNSLSRQEVQEKSLAICHNIKKHPSFTLAKKLGVYMANGQEVDLSYLLHDCWRLNKECYAPVIISNLNTASPVPKMTFNKFDCLPPTNKVGNTNHNGGNLWRPNIYGIQEPYKTTAITLWTLDAVFMPLVAFDERGGRLGMGGGYYDHTFAFCQGDKSDNMRFTKRPLLIGVAYGLQQLSNIPMETTDINMDYVVTENGWLEFK
ncbi:MAG: hypothetical protein K0U41_10015 [Gammaproteobacteria bacterium]|nr:hypothetical protein [Gammaproteobacteria bacterium]